MKVIGQPLTLIPDGNRVRLEVLDKDIIEISPEGGELMFTIEVEYIDDRTEGMPNGALKLKVLPWHMDGISGKIENEIVEVISRG